MNTVYPCLNQKRVLVTGGASGIGAAIVSAFVQQGAYVDFFDRDAALAQRLQSEINSERVFFQQGDAASSLDITRWCAHAIKRWGGIDVLINNVANDDRHEFSSISENYLDNNLAINFKSHVYATQAVIAAMKQQASGCIINVSSNCFLLGLSGYPLYASMKAALLGLTRSLAREYGVHGIRVNALIPGWVMTERQLRDWVTPQALEELLQQQSLKATIKPQDIANAALFLSSSQAQFITAQSLIIDGGRV